MGLFDWFEPDPPIRCLECNNGTTVGWQEKHSGHGLFLWRQGSSVPVDQLVDDECRIDLETRNKKRLPTDEGLAIYYGKCDTCGATFPYQLPLAFSGDTWIGFSESDHVKFGEEVDQGWLQCPKCLVPQKVELEQIMVVCDECKLLLLRKSEEEST